MEDNTFTHDSNERVSWFDYFMSIASVVCIRSHDKHTKHGAVIVDSKRRILGLGYNGTPRGKGNEMHDPVYPSHRPEKYKYVAHAELNAILNCSIRPEEATIYVTGPPCSACMIAIIQSGIKSVVYGKVGSNMIDESDWEATRLLAKNHGINLVDYNSSNASTDPRNILQQTITYLDKKGWDSGKETIETGN